MRLFDAPVRAAGTPHEFAYPQSYTGATAKPIKPSTIQTTKILLVGGSVVLALLAHVGADQYINTVLAPITHWWLGLPVVLGVPLLFGVLRKELSLLMISQALGSFEVGRYLDQIQIMTFLLFLTFYVPCVSTFAVMLKTIGRREALFSVALSVGVALLVSGIARFGLEGARYLLA